MDNLTKQFLVKIAYTPAPFQGQVVAPGAAGMTPEQMGAGFGQDVQTYGHLTPGTVEYNDVLRQKGYTPEYMRGVTSMGQRMLGAADSPEFINQVASGQPNFQQLSSGINPYEALGGAKGVANLVLRNPSLAFNLATANGRNQLMGQFQRGMAGSLNRQSPLAQKALSRAGTTFMSNKLDDWSKRIGGSWGHQLGGLGQFLLGLFSKMPGYQTIVNKGIDWFGPKNLSQYFPATPGAQPAPAQLPAPQKTASAYSYYRTVYRHNEIEVLSPWNHR
jgi:hypothetical protein